MTFLGPLKFINADGSPVTVVGWQEAQGLWDSQIGAVKKPRVASARAPAAKSKAVTKK
jgi:hypothetical protein